MHFIYPACASLPARNQRDIASERWPCMPTSLSVCEQQQTHFLHRSMLHNLPAWGLNMHPFHLLSITFSSSFDLMGAGSNIPAEQQTPVCVPECTVPRESVRQMGGVNLQQVICSLIMSLSPSLSRQSIITWHVFEEKPICLDVQFWLFWVNRNKRASSNLQNWVVFMCKPPRLLKRTANLIITGSSPYSDVLIDHQLRLYHSLIRGWL